MGKNKTGSAILGATSAQNALSAKAIKDNISKRLRSEIMLSLFNKTFEVVIASTNEQRELAHQIRYRVFCEENLGYEDHTAHMNDMEVDEYDIYADHILLIYKPTNTAIGTLRVIRPNAHNWEQSFPLQRICKAAPLKNKRYINESCEFSRLCISRTLRKQAQKHLESNKALFTSSKTPFNIIEKPFLNHMPLSLARRCQSFAVRMG
jgi:N-acyl amino acid synthase of PEP-CTERM/exosortase system